MTPEKEKYFYDTYPNLFVDKDLPMTQTCMCWGFDCGDGWFDILDELCKKITARCEEMGYTDVRVSQVKEKWGTLRFYMNHADDEIYKYIDEAEAKSENTCEKCGAPGTCALTTNGWYGVRCDKCSKK